MRRAVRGEDGQAVVELALVLPLFLVLLLGLAQVGLVLNAQQQLVTVARQGARTYALGLDPSSTAAAIRLAGRQIARFDDRSVMTILITDQRSGAAQRGSAKFRGDAWKPGDSLHDVFPSAFKVQRGAVRRGDWITVSVTYRYANPIRASILGLRLPETFPLVSSATARVERDPTVPPPLGTAP